MKPAHVGLIPDGLRRWARAHNTTLTDSYRLGAEHAVEIFLALQRNDVQTVTAYNLSRANLARAPHELDAVYTASIYLMSTLIPANFDPAECGVRIHGDRSLLPDEFVAAAHAVETAMTGDRFRINLLAAYDAADELRAAHQRAVHEGCDINDAFEIGEVDLVLRTTPEPLLSGFLPIQTQYAQLLFLSTPLNELTAQHIDGFVEDFRRSPQLRGR